MAFPTKELCFAALFVALGIILTSYVILRGFMQGEKSTTRFVSVYKGEFSEWSNNSYKFQIHLSEKFLSDLRFQNASSKTKTKESLIVKTKCQNVTCRNCEHSVRVWTDTVKRDAVEKYSSNAPFKCINMSITPKTPVCIYPVEIDTFISRQLLEQGTWEPHIVRRFQNILNSDPSIGIIDLGANVGVYSLIAAHMGHLVIAVEPHLPNIQRLVFSSSLAGTEDRITLLQNGVADFCGVSKLQVNPDNQGDIRLKTIPHRLGAEPKLSSVKNQKTAIHRSRNPSHALNRTELYVETITLGCLTKFIKFPSAVLKIDIQGFEQKIFKDFETLYQSTNVTHIFMEWSMMREFFETEYHKSKEKSEVICMIQTLHDKGYQAFSPASGKRLPNAYWYGWPDDVIWIK